MQAVTYTPKEVLAYQQDFERRMTQGDKSACWEYLEWINALRRLQRRG